MKYITTHESKKLHYRKYLYKLRISNDLASIFRTEYQRNGKLSFARSKLDVYQSSVRSNYAFVKKPFGDQKVHIDDLKDAKTIYRYLLDSDDYLVRCEYNALILYTDDYNLIQRIVNNLQTDLIELWKPKKEYEDFLKKNINTIIINQPSEFEYKVTFGRKKARIELADWIIKNPNQVKATDYFVGVIKEGGYVHSLYLYAKNEKTILLLQMLAGENITRIDKLIYKANIR